MEFMSGMMRWLYFCGIYPKPGEWQIWRFFKRFISIVFVLETVIPISIYLLSVEHNLNEISAALYSLIMFGGMFSQYLIYVYHSKDVRLLIEDMVVWVNKQRELNKHDIFDKVERRINRYFRIFERVTFVSYTAFVTAPGLTQFLAARRGPITDATYSAPYHDLYYFFKTTESPLYEIFYVAFSIGVFYVMVIYFAKGFLFITMCFYFVALYDDLKKMLLSMDQQSCVTTRRRIASHCVHVHNQIYRFTERANGVMNVVIFIQLVYSLLALTMWTFSFTFIDVTQMLALVINTGCLAGELFLFCWTGSMLLEEAENINLCVYNLNWFNYTVSEQKCLLLILIRKHRPMGLSAFNYFTCNLATFYWIMTKVYSAFTFLQSMA